MMVGEPRFLNLDPQRSPKTMVGEPHVFFGQFGGPGGLGKRQKEFAVRGKSLRPPQLQHRVRDGEFRILTPQNGFWRSFWFPNFLSFPFGVPFWYPFSNLVFGVPFENQKKWENVYQLKKDRPTCGSFLGYLLWCCSKKWSHEWVPAFDGSTCLYQINKGHI